MSAEEAAATTASTTASTFLSPSVFAGAAEHRHDPEE